MKKRRIVYILFALLFLVGLSLLLYPFLSNLWNSYRSAQLISDYTEQVETLPADTGSEWFAKADAYNASLVGKGIPDAFADISPEESADYLSQLAFRDDGVMGYIEIPKIQVELPIYHGTGEEALARGAGHLQGSALPVGGAGTHCVISAHRGLPSAAMFTDLDRLELGDHFYFHVLDRVLAYEVDQILVVEPSETESLDVTAGEDLATLVTCTPYGVNTHRLLVRGHRVDYVPETAEAEAAQSTKTAYTNYGLWVVVGLAVTALFVFALYRFTRRRDDGAAPAAVSGKRTGESAGKAQQNARPAQSAAEYKGKREAGKK